MMGAKEKVTVPVSFAATDEGQSRMINTKPSILEQLKYYKNNRIVEEKPVGKGLQFTPPLFREIKLCSMHNFSRIAGAKSHVSCDLCASRSVLLVTE